jgi:hypothetical protein
MSQSAENDLHAYPCDDFLCRSCHALAHATPGPFDPVIPPGQTCPDCDHIHTPEGCTGPQSPSDRWAGVSPSACDCDTVIPPGGSDA